VTTLTAQRRAGRGGQLSSRRRRARHRRPAAAHAARRHADAHADDEQRGGGEPARAQASVVITPDAAGVGLLEFHQIDRMREQGRLATRAALPAIEQALARAAVPEALEAAAPR
jgi:predicted acylesterase/phospholipase RssA